jgi:hypothetical protein
MNIPYTPGVIVRYKGPSSSRGSRVFLELLDRGLPKKTISYDYARSHVYEMAADALTKAGFTVSGYTDHKDGYVVLVNWEVPDANFSIKALWGKVGK